MVILLVGDGLKCDFVSLKHDAVRDLPPARSIIA